MTGEKSPKVIGGLASLANEDASALTSFSFATEATAVAAALSVLSPSSFVFVTTGVSSIGVVEF